MKIPLPLNAEPRFDASIYLLKANWAAVALGALQSTADEELPLAADYPDGRFFSYPVQARAPSWMSTVQQFLQTTGPFPALQTQAPGGLLWMPILNQTFVLSFGNAHNQLQSDWIEPEFGKHVALSIVPPESIVEIKAEQVFARKHIANERAPRASDFRTFNFKADRDLFGGVEGVPANKHQRLFGSKVRGGTSLKAYLALSTIKEALEEASSLFSSNAYRRQWSTIDYLTLVKDDQLISALDGKLDARLVGSRPETDLTIAVPLTASTDARYPQQFAIGRMTQNPVMHPYLTLASWLARVAAKGDVPTTAIARNFAVHLLDEEGNEVGQSTIYDCLGAEVLHKGRLHVLSSGNWYEARGSFVTEINAKVAALTAPKYALGAWNGSEHEDKYNLRMTKIDPSIKLFDRKLIPIGGGRSRLEFCDLLHLPSKTLYFVKQPSASAGLSHLCEQVRRTAENFFHYDGDFRAKLRANIDARLGKQHSKWLASQPLRRDWTLCLVSMGKPATKVPFFARCGIATATRDLEQAGYNVAFQEV